MWYKDMYCTRHAILNGRVPLYFSKFEETIGVTKGRDVTAFHLAVAPVAECDLGDRGVSAENNHGSKLGWVVLPSIKCKTIYIYVNKLQYHNIYEHIMTIWV